MSSRRGKEATEVLYARIPASLKTRVDELAAKHNWSLTDAAAILIDEAMTARESGRTNPIEVDGANLVGGKLLITVEVVSPD